MHIKEGRVLPVPKPLRGSSYQGAKRLGNTGYQYAHEYKDHFVDQAYMPTSAVYYEPTSQGYEDTLKQRLEQWDLMRQKAQQQANVQRPTSNTERPIKKDGGKRTKNNETGQHS